MDSQNNNVSSEMQVNTNPEIVAPNKSRSVKLIGAVLLLLALAGGAYAYIFSPSRVWSKFVAGSAMRQDSMKSSFLFSYSDSEDEKSELAEPEASWLKNVNFSLAGNGYQSSKDLNNPQLDMNFTYKLGSGNSNFSTGMRVLMLNRNIYLNIQDNPLFMALGGMAQDGKKYDWVKMDIEAMQKMAEEENPDKPKMDFDFQKQVLEYQQVLSKHMPGVVTTEKFLGREKISGVQTLHFKNKVDGEKMQNLVNELFAAMLNQVSQNTEVSAEEKEKAKKTFGQVMQVVGEKGKILNLETWVGAKDGKLYKLKLESNAPSLKSLLSSQNNNSDSSLSPEEEVLAAFRAVEFSGKFSFEQENSEYGIEREIKEPDNFMDLVEVLRKQRTQFQAPAGEGLRVN